MVTTKKEDDIFFVGLSEPTDIRRCLLESLKGTVENLQRFERFKAVREEKISTVAALKVQIKEIQKLVAKAKTEIPKGHLRIKLGVEHAEIEETKAKKAAKKKGKKKVAKKKEVKTEEIKEVVKAPVKPKALSELEKLEAELSNIESKLGRIS